MFTDKRLVGICLFVFALAGTALAQGIPAPVEMPREAVAPGGSAPLVTVAATAERVRFVSPGSVVQLRLEVYNDAGQKLFDTELRGGNVLDWHLQNGAGERLPAGSYACVLTTKSLSGRLSQRVGRVTVSEQKTMVEGAAQLSVSQQQVIGPVEDNSAVQVLPESEAKAITAVTHDGSKGQLTSTAGALSLGTGDVFAGTDKEHMRITEEGRVGIGTSKPEAALDVAGAVRVSEGVKFSDGTTLNATSGKLTVRDGAGELVPSAAGTGTINRLAKWNETGGAGTLGDSGITETPATGFIGIGTAAPQFPFHLEHATYAQAYVSGGIAADFLMYHRNAPANARFTGLRSQDGKGKFSSFNDNRSYRHEAIIAWDNATANVGMGTINPTARLDVVGTQPGTVPTGASNHAGLVLKVIGGKGGNSGGVGGNGGSALIQGGDGSDGGSSPAGRGGSITLQPGLPGFESFITGPGMAGNVLLAPSRGNVGIGTTNPTAMLHVIGAPPPRPGEHAAEVLRVIGGDGGEGASSLANPGIGGSVHLQGGKGGMQYEGRPGAKGGSITLQPGAGGLSETGSPGSAGNVLLAPSVGQVGIGTTAPLAKLDIQGGAGSDGSLDPKALAFSFRDGGFRHWLRTRHNGAASASNAIDFFVNNSTTADGSSAPGTGNQHVMSLDGGNVGIGTMAPEQQLHVVGNEILSTGSSSGFKFRNRGSNSSGDDWVWYSSGNIARFFRNGIGDLLFVSTTGNLGIGASNPASKLHVAGGDVAITTQLTGLILRATDGGTCYRLTVNNVGALSTTVVACP